MNLSILKSPGFWITAITTIVGLLMTSGLVLSGTSVDHVLGWILTLAGVVGGHQVALPAPTDPAAPAN